MKLLTKLVLPAAVLAFGLAFNSTVSLGKPDYTKKEKKACNYCHVKGAKGDAKDLTDAGTYYKDHDHSLDGYQPKKK
jgi:hypothetical protein